jgi:signal peptidase I
MDWLASLSIGWTLSIAFALVALRMGAYQSRSSNKYEPIIGETLESLLFAWVVVFLAFRPFAYEPFSIPSPSMETTLMVGDRIIVNKYAYRFHPPQRGDVVVFKSPPEAKMNQVDFVKRLIGLPGDTIVIEDGKLYVNGALVKEPYVHERMNEPPYTNDPAEPKFPYHVPPHHYLMMGDNRNNSADSRYWGYLDEWRIKGKAVAIFWPPKHMSVLKQYDYSYIPKASEKESASVP